MKFRLGKYRFLFWISKERPSRFRSGSPSRSYEPFFWINASCWSGQFGIPWIGEKLSETGRGRYKVLRCPTEIQGNIGRLMFWISYEENTTCHIKPIILKKLDV